MRSLKAISVWFFNLTVCYLCAFSASAQDATVTSAATTGRLTVELNKLEQTPEGNCRAYFLFRNGMSETLESFELSLAILNSSGVIDRLLTVDASPIPVGRTTLKLFEIPEISCSDVSQVLLHDIGTCKLQNGSEIDCFPLIDLNSRAAAALVE